MTPALSVLIPARNEQWLTRTVADVLAHSQPATEVIVVLDGAWPDPGLPLDPRVHVIYHPEARGQRAATNEAARVSTAPYICKLDAHCSVAPGWDVELLAAAEILGRNVIQVPAQKNLYIFDWVCGDAAAGVTGCGWRAYQGPTPPACPTCASPIVSRDIKWKPRRGTTTTSWRFDETLHFQYWRDHQQPAGDYPDTMSLLGACWFLDRQWFLDDLEGLDERHGSWGNMGTELACKAWLSGGRLVCNRRTWFAHLFRTQGGDFGFPYPMQASDQERAREHSRSLWRANAWPKQTRTLRSLVEQFTPPGWSPAAMDALPSALGEVGQLGHAGQWFAGFGAGDAVMLHGTEVAVESPAAPRTAGVVYYTDSRGDEDILEAARRQLAHAAAGLPIVAVSLPQPYGIVTGNDPTFAGMRHVVLPLERGYLAMARQILTGLELLDTDVVFFCEHDCLYPVGYFDHRPAAGVYEFAANTWKVDAASGRALFYECEQLSGLVADRRLLLDHFRRRVAHIEAHGFTRRLGFEPGKPIRHGGLDDVPRATWWNDAPIVDIRHSGNLTPSRWSREQFRNQKYTKGWTEADAVPHWGQTAGRFGQWLAEVTTHG